MVAVPYHPTVFGVGAAWILDGLQATISSSLVGVPTQPRALGMTSSEIGPGWRHNLHQPREYDLSSTQYGVLVPSSGGGRDRGLAAFRTGPLLDHGVGLSGVYATGAVIAAAMGLLSFAVTRRPVREADAQCERQSVAGPVRRPA